MVEEEKRKMSLIDGIGWASRGYESQELQAFAQNRLAGDAGDTDKIQELFDSLNISVEMQNTLFDKIMNSISEREMRGFQSGFRMGVQLIIECLWAPGSSGGAAAKAARE